MHSVAQTFVAHGHADYLFAVVDIALYFHSLYVRRGAAQIVAYVSPVVLGEQHVYIHIRQRGYGIGYGASRIAVSWP